MKANRQFSNAYGIDLNKKKHIELLVFLLCFELVLAFSYLGFIQLPPISVTTLTITVIIAAMYFGPWDAMAVSLVFAFASMWKASLTSTEIGDTIFSPVLSGNPAGSIILAVVPRLLFGLFAGLMFRWFFSKERKHRKLGIAAISLIATGLHALLIWVFMVVFFRADQTATTTSFDWALVISNVILYVLTILAAFFADWIIRKKSVADFFRLTSREKTQLTREQKRIYIIVTVSLLVMGIFTCLHFVSRLVGYISDTGTGTAIRSTWLYALLAQFLIGFSATFGIMVIVIRWMQEYFYALALNASRQARITADAANKSKSDFLFNMSHDIRTPMNAIKGFTAMAKKHSGEKGLVEEYMDKIDISGRQLLTIINQVLEMSRIESGKIEFNETPVNICEKFNAMVMTLSEQANANGQTFRHAIKNLEHNRVFADEARMNSITLNIAGNALKYTPAGGTVDFILEEVPARRPEYATYVFTVQDTGIGMSKEFLKELYEPFSRAKSSTVSGIQGTGLGLSIVKNLVDILGGKIEVQSEPGKGTRFDITLDFRIDANPETETVPEETGTVSFAGRRVLLVEDNEMNREIAGDILREHGLEVEEADDGTKAVVLLKEKGPDYYDFVLMDIQMPLMNGYEATKNIRDMYPGNRPPIIALSANAFAEDKAKSIDAGMNGHVAKPIDINELFGVLKKHL